MPRKSYKPEEIVAKLRQVDVLTSQGLSVAEAIRSIGVSEVTYYRWRQEFGWSSQVFGRVLVAPLNANQGPDDDR
jgi:transposase-like protein